MDETFVYFISHGDGEFENEQFFKVGIAADVGKRIAQLQTGNPAPLEAAWTVALPTRRLAAKVEQEIHRTLVRHRVGGEWFKCTYTQAAAALPRAVRVFQSELGLNNKREVLEFIGYPQRAA